MSSHFNENLSSNQRKELRRLRRGRSQFFLRLILISLVGLIVLYSFQPNLFVFNLGSNSIEEARNELISQKVDWAHALSREQATLADWLDRRGAAYEGSIFNYISKAILFSAANLSSRSDAADLSPLLSVYLALHFGLLRVAFIITACSRLWVLLLLYGVYRGFRAWKPYVANDIAGQTGNSRIYYSGIRAGLEDLNSSGAPNKQVIGLACPKRASDAKLRNSKLYGVLEKYNAANNTNMTLAAIILEYSHYPAYVSAIEEQNLLASFVTPINLFDSSVGILERGMDLFLHYKSAQKDAQFSAYLHDVSTGTNPNSPMNREAYFKYLQKALHRVLSDNQRNVIGSMRAEQICTFLLAIEAGKVMAFAQEAGRWHRVSNYPQLSSRAVLHSVEHFAKEYDYEERTLLRRAIIYSSRSSDFGMVKMPVDLSVQSRALRQWAEVLIASPYEVDNAANQAEMYSILFEANLNFTQALFDAIMLSDQKIIGGSYVTMGNLLLMPFSRVFKLTRKSLTSANLKRLDELAQITLREARLRSLEVDISKETIEKNSTASSSKMFSVLTPELLEELKQNYGLPEQALREWSSLRLILNNFGWLARRVGDYSVPEAALIFAVMQSEAGDPAANEHGLIGAPAMVALRAGRFEERWGKSWRSRVKQVIAATMAENKEDYSRLMRGETLNDLEDSPVVNA